MEKLKIERNSVLSSKYFCVIFCIFCVFPLVNPKSFCTFARSMPKPEGLWRTTTLWESDTVRFVFGDLNVGNSNLYQRQ